MRPLDAMPFHNRVLERAPNWATAHLAIAETDAFVAGFESSGRADVRASHTVPSPVTSSRLAAIANLCVVIVPTAPRAS